MKIAVIDDEPNVVRLVCLGLSHQGHEVQGFADGVSFLGNLPEDLDFVITDLAMPEIDGCRLALRVSAVLGHTPPRVLLMTGYEVQASQTVCKPSLIVGTLLKPFRLDRLVDVVEVIAATRDCCPGLVYEEFACPHVQRRHATPLAEYCRCSEYATCPQYNASSGRRLQEWIHSSTTEDLTPCEAMRDTNASAVHECCHS